MYKTLTFKQAREAVRYLIKKYNIKEMNIPYYLCDVVRHTLMENGCKPVFYHIDDNFCPTCEFNKDDYVLYPNYWGVCNENVKKLVDIYPKLIVDNAHAYYNEPEGFACFNAGHKFGYKSSYLWIQSESQPDNVIFYDDGKKHLRQKKFLELNKEYQNSNLLKIDTNSIPFVYPYLAKNIKQADELAIKLKKEGKTIYRYWNPLPESFCEYKFYSRLVPIPILP